MTWITQNWYLIVALIACMVCIVTSVSVFIQMPRKKQIDNLKEWLKWAVVECEKQLGSKTGQAKLRMCYDMAIAKFSWLSFISFDTFSEWVDEAVEWLNNQLDGNTNLKEYVEHGGIKR